MFVYHIESRILGISEKDVLIFEGEDNWETTEVPTDESISDFSVYDFIDGELVLNKKRKKEADDRELLEHNKNVYRIVVDTCSRKLQEVKTELLGKSSSEHVLAMYEKKVKHAKNKEYSELELEAYSKGITVQELASRIISNNIEYHKTIDSITSKLEVLRTVASKEINSGNYGKVEDIVNHISSITKNTTSNEIKEWLK